MNSLIINYIEKAKSRILLFLILSSVFLAGNAQNNNARLLKSDCLANRNEKVFVQTDKQVYISGETIHATTFVVNA